MFEYLTTGTCSKKITFDIGDNRLKNLEFTGGCNGNLKALCKLLEGMPVNEVVEQFQNIQCKDRGTSCVDQLAKAILEALNSQHI
jgi:uncharacterized protein (TIGR03905 family)